MESSNRRSSVLRPDPRSRRQRTPLGTPLLRGAVLSILGLVLGLACRDTTGPDPESSLDVPNRREFMEIGESFQFTAVTTGGGRGDQVVWRSSNPAIVTIDETGLAVARAAGASEITVSFAGGGLSWRLVVTRQIAMLSVVPDDLEVVPGDRVLFTVIATDANGAPVTENDSDTHELAALAVWTVGDLAVARPEDAGQPSLLTLLREGQTTVRATLFAHVGSTTLTARGLDAAELATGGGFSCALSTDSLPFCWGAGREYLGSPGTGPWSPEFIPHRVGVRLPLAHISTGGRHACGLTADGLAYCWGSNELGALGMGTAEQPTGPVPVSGGLRFTTLAAGGTHTCGIATDGRTFCWGVRHGAASEDGPDICGSAGKASITIACSRAPLLLGDGSDRFTSLAAGGRHTCGLDAGGQATCWGVWGSRNDPAPVTMAGTPFTALTSGDGYSCGLNAQGAAHCWGANNSGQLGDGSTTSRDEPAPVAGGLTFASLSAGRSEFLGPLEGHVCGLTQTGAAYCWGRNLSGELGAPSGSPRSSPSPVGTSVGFRSVQAGSNHTCGLSVGQLVFCWGANYNGQLGVAEIDESWVPVVVRGQRVGAP